MMHGFADEKERLLQMSKASKRDAWYNAVARGRFIWRK
jgi:hypothetical protein